MAAEVALRGLLSSLGVKEPDADLFSYVCTLLVEEEDEDCLETVREMLSSMAPAYASRPDAVQRRAVLDLFEVRTRPLAGDMRLCRPAGAAIVPC